MKSSINPYTQEKIYSFKELTTKQLKEKLQQSHECFLEWRETTFEQRSDLMNRAAKALVENKILYAETISKEMGKPISQAVAEIEKCAWVCEYYAEKVKDQLKDEAKDELELNSKK